METSPRHSPASKGFAERTVPTIGEQLRTLRYDAQKTYKARITLESAIWSWMVGYAGFCVTRYARETGCITPFRAAYDRDYTQKTVPFAETILFKILVPEHRGLSSGKRLRKGHAAWDKGIWLGKSETNFEHFAGTKHGAMGARTIRWLEPTKRSDTSLLIEEQGVPWDLVPNAPRCGRTQETPDTCTSFTTSPRKNREMTNQAVQATVLFRRHHQHKLRMEFRSTQILKLIMASNVPVVLTLPEPPTTTPEAQLKSSTPTKRAAGSQDTGRASTGKASVRRRLADGRSKFDGGWSRDIWN